ncbi:hypothetical protein ACWD1Y_43755 [Streptomyces sp. NPDC002814]
MIPTLEGPLWLSAIRDAFSRRVVAWETSAAQWSTPSWSHAVGAPWDVQYVLAQDPRPRQLIRAHSVGDEDGLRLALTALLQVRPAHQDIDGDSGSSSRR